MPTGPQLPEGWTSPIPAQRLSPVPRRDRSPETEALLDTLRVDPSSDDVPNLFTTLAHHPRLLKRWTGFGGLLLLRGGLPDRDRELLIMRTAWHCRAHYEWVHHEDFARRAGMSEEEITRVTAGPGDPAWSDEDALLLRAADELHEAARLSDETWAALAERYDEAQLIEVCMVVGQYHLVAFTLNSLGVQLEDRYLESEDDRPD